MDRITTDARSMEQKWQGRDEARVERRRQAFQDADARARKEEERRQWQARVMSPIFATVYVCRNVMSAIGYFRSYRMRTQLLLSFGLVELPREPGQRL